MYPNWPQGGSLIPALYPRKTTHAQKQIPTHNHKFRFSASDRIANSDIIRHYRIAFASWCHDDYYMGYGPSMVMASPQIFRSQLSCCAVLWSGAPQFVHGAKRTQCGGEAILHTLIYMGAEFITLFWLLSFQLDSDNRFVIICYGLRSQNTRWLCFVLL